MNPDIIYEYLRSSKEFLMIGKLILALVCGGIIGLEREQKKRPAGFRTYMLVCIGSALVMMTNQFLVTIYPHVDPSRMGAQVISGIGFLGVGTIIVTGINSVKGLTTAAGLWSTAAVGLAIGAGYLLAGITVTILIFIVIKFFQTFDNRLGKNSKVMSMYVEFEDITDVGRFIRGLRSEHVKIYEMELKPSSKISDVATAGMFTISFSGKVDHSVIIEKYNSMEGVIYAEEI